jgi:hypothetical protein
MHNEDKKRLSLWDVNAASYKERILWMNQVKFVSENKLARYFSWEKSSPNNQ